MGNKIKEIYKIIDWELVGIPKKKMEVAELIWSKMSEHFPKDEEKPKYDFVCPHSGYGFNEGDESYYISCNHKDSPKKNGGWFSLTNYYAYFPTSELAIQWNKERFGEKDNKKEALENIEKFVKETPKEEIVERLENNSPKQPIKEEEEYKCKKCGDTGRIEPYSIENPDGEECECSVKQDWKQPFEITYKEGQTTTFGGVKYTLGHGKWIREETQTLEERVSDLQLKYNTIILTLDVIGGQINKLNSLNK